MTFDEARLTLQLAAEERVGFVMRERQRMVLSQQDAAFEAAKMASAQATDGHR